MATPSGQISLSNVNAELGFSPTALISMNDAAVRTLAGVPTGAISMQNLQNKSNRVSIPLTISGNTYNYDVYSSRGPTYNPGKSDITVTINPGVLVGSTSTGTFAFSIPSAFSPADTITVVNNGTIQGMGGAGGRGGGPGVGNAVPGSSGGTALRVQRPATITNNGTIAGGGGGGGGGRGGQRTDPDQGDAGSSVGGGGGGGGAGFNGGGGGAGGTGSLIGPNFTVSPGGPGNSGTSPAGGSGGGGGAGSFPLDRYASGESGGNGGGRGGAGSAPVGGGFNNIGPLASGGGAGAYISGLPFVTWPATGTRQGPSS